MISHVIVWELYALAVSFFRGVLLAWVYDNIRVYRRIIRHKTIVFMSIEDIAYGIVDGYGGQVIMQGQQAGFTYGLRRRT